jgi:hypothetical protein
MKQHQKIEKNKKIKIKIKITTYCSFSYFFVFSWWAAVDNVLCTFSRISTYTSIGYWRIRWHSVLGRSVRSAGTLFDPRALCSIRARSDFVGYVSADMTWHDLLPKSGAQIWHKLLTPHFVQRLSLILKPKPKKKLEEKKKEKELNLDQYSFLYIIHTWVLSCSSGELI